MAVAQEKTNHLVVVEVARQHQRRHMRHKLGALKRRLFSELTDLKLLVSVGQIKGFVELRFRAYLVVLRPKTLVTARKRSLGQVNVFTPICESVHRGVYPSMQWGRHLSRQTPPSDRHLCWADTTSLPRQTPSHPRIIRDTVNKRAVRILTVKGSFKLSKSERERELFSLILVIGFYI